MRLAPLLFIAVASLARADEITVNREPAQSYKPAKEAGIAYTLAGAATVLPIVVSAFAFQSDGDVGTLLTAGALFVGPSTGQFYAGSYGAGLAGVGIRTGGAVLALASVGDLIGDNGDANGFLAGGVIFIGGTLYSIVDTYFAVNRANERERKSASRTSLSPALLPLGEGRFAPGMAFNATF